MHAQSPEPASTQSATEETFSTEQLDALLAPVALYPDPLLTQLLMASTFPLQVVQAGRWVEDPAHKDLKADALTKALEAEPWDPSVKSLVPFPQVLALMNQNLDWLQQLGYAFSGQQPEVFDSVQRLRKQAMDTGHLQSSEQQVVRTEQVAYTAGVTAEGAGASTQGAVTTERTAIVIEPAKPDVVYVPSYNPATTYGAWPYPSYPPAYLPPPPGYAFGNALVGGLAFGAGVAITAGLWNWASPSWGGGNANVNVNRYNTINANRGQISSERWQANRSNVRAAGATRPPGGPVGRPARTNGLPAGAVGRSNVAVPGSAVRPPARTAGAAGAGGAARAGQGGAATRATAGARPQTRPAQAGNAANRANRPAQSAAANRPANAGVGQRQAGASAGSPQRRQTAFNDMNQGRQANQFAQRGAQSRSSAQTQRPTRQASTGSRGGDAPRGGGGARGGGGGARGGGGGGGGGGARGGRR